jgi:hypothetical protein
LQSRFLVASCLQYQRIFFGHRFWFAKGL